MLPMAANGSLKGRSLRIKNEMFECTRVRITKGGRATGYVTPKVGMPEGKKLSPTDYGISTALEAEMLDKEGYTSIGFNPPREGIRAYHKYVTGVTAEILHMQEVIAWNDLRMQGALDWWSIMEQASTDDIRLALLDEASTVRVGAIQYVDDTKIKIASRSQAVWTFAQVKAGARAARAVVARGRGNRGCPRKSVRFGCHH